MAVRVTARIAAFIPDASPPEVRIPIYLLFIIHFYTIIRQNQKVTALIFSYYERYGFLLYLATLLFLELFPDI